jgi:hypothetical protein
MDVLVKEYNIDGWGIWSEAVGGIDDFQSLLAVFGGSNVMP